MNPREGVQPRARASFRSARGGAIRALTDVTDGGLAGDVLPSEVLLGFVAVVGAAAEGQVRRGRRSAPGERVDMVELELMPRGTALARVPHEGALAAIARPHLVPNGRRDVSTPRRRRLGRGPLAGAAAATVYARQGDAQALVQHLLQSGPGQLVRKRLANRLQIGDEGSTDRDPQDVALRSDRLQPCRRTSGRTRGAGAGWADAAGGVGAVGVSGEAGMGTSFAWWPVLPGTSSGPEPPLSFRRLGSFRSRSGGAGCGRRAATSCLT